LRASSPASSTRKKAPPAAAPLMANKTIVSLSLAGLLLVIAGVVFLNPFNLFLQRSRRFSYDAFGEIKPG
jgi:hypothetical protein